MATIMEAPNRIAEDDFTSVRYQKRLFLAGGITDCPDWQAEVIEQIKDLDNLTIFNPRRANFRMEDDPVDQITWEFDQLTTFIDSIIFWFPKETLCPITLYELGFQMGIVHTAKKSYVHDEHPLFIGAHPEYKRRIDVEIQAKMAGYKHPIHNTLDDVVNAFRAYHTSRRNDH